MICYFRKRGGWMLTAAQSDLPREASKEIFEAQGGPLEVITKTTTQESYFYFQEDGTLTVFKTEVKR